MTYNFLLELVELVIRKDCNCDENDINLKTHVFEGIC
jgi:hypothetical protein